MNLVFTGLIFLLVILTLFISLCLALISKYYHQKAGRGPKPIYFFAYSLVFSLGQIFRLPFLENALGASVAAICLIIGGGGIILSSVTLYRSMMSVEKG